MTNIKKANVLCLILIFLNIGAGFVINFFLVDPLSAVLLVEAFYLIPGLLYLVSSRTSLANILTKRTIPFLLYIIGAFGVGLLPGLLTDSQLRLMVSQSIVFLPMLCLCIMNGEHLFKKIRFRKINIRTALLVIVFTYAIMPLLGVVNAFSMLFSTNVIQSTVGSVMDGEPLLKGLLFLAIVPAFVEETVYRGFFYQTYRGERPVRGILISALLFGAVHMNFNQFTYAVLLGVIMGMMIEAADSILAPMLVHFTFNGNSVVMSYILPKIQNMLVGYGVDEASLNLQNGMTLSNQEILSSIISLLPVALAGTVFALAIFYLIASTNGRAEYIRSWFKKPAIHKPQEKIMDPYLAVSIGLCLGFAVLTEIAYRI